MFDRVLYEVERVRLQFELCHLGHDAVQVSVRAGVRLLGALGAREAGGARGPSAKAPATPARSHRLWLQLATSVEPLSHVTRHVE